MNMNKAFNLVFTGMGLWLFLAFFSSQLGCVTLGAERTGEKRKDNYICAENGGEKRGGKKRHGTVASFPAGTCGRGSGLP